MPKTIKKIIKVTVIVILGFFLIHMPLTTPIAYEAFFLSRYETPDWLEYSLSDFDGLMMERSDFSSGKNTLAGYKYSSGSNNAKGVVVIAHGMGGGGHNQFLPYIDYFTDAGYYVFAYDATGNDASEGKNVRGLPQGLIDLDNALTHLKTLPEYRDLPIVLFGHSWGGYSVGNVLEFHPDVSAAAIVAGFNESEDMISFHAGRFVGPFVYIGLPYVDAYERIKFGNKYATTSALDAMGSTEAGIMMIQGGVDTTVPAECGYDKVYAAYSGNERFEFVFYPDREHKYIFYSDEAYEYIKELEAEYMQYIKATGKKNNARTRNEFLEENLDASAKFNINPDLAERLVSFYDKYCIN